MTSLVYPFMNQCRVRIAGHQHGLQTTSLGILSIPPYDVVTIDPVTYDIVLTFAIPQTGEVCIWPLAPKDTV